MLSPALFTLFTSDCSAINSTDTIVKFTDDTTVVGLISDNDETHYREEIQHLTQCDAHGEDIDSLTHCLTDYINFCVENTVPTRTVRSFSNSKPWITPDIKALLKEKRRAFVSGNKEELKSVQRELRRMIRKGKDCYRRKMEHQLQQNNICGVWKGLKTISGFKEPKSQPVGDQGWANDLNLFFNRFDQASAPPPAQSPLLQPPSQSLPPVHGSSCAPSPLSHDPQFTPT
ncbi:hypothetical protein L3Q82_004163 [Scortum barcoo]|uniref:Uncharacterized protein n=1 Tax=Scortum barcoo TaxID=214431 RepID=A0ACB8X7E6_9TELE|nr:hypothetical protein L3Q82_004163 [Scortum barcoo]